MILDEIAAKTKERVAEQKKRVPLEEMKRQALDIVARETNNGSNIVSSHLGIIWRQMEYRLSVRSRRHHLPRDLSHRTFLMLRSQRNMRRLVLQLYRCSLSRFISREAISS
jgi:hypothetical protein